MLSAQTYRNGTWYAFYDDAEHAMNTQGDYDTGGIFAPTNGTLNVQWRYEWIDWLGAFRKIDTRVYESADNGANTKEVGALAENTDNNSNTNESFNISRDINWIQFERSGYPTHKVVVYHMDIPLAKHILLPSGAYGTSSASYDLGEQDALTVSKAYSIPLRSFLSAGDITVTSSDPQIFRVGDKDNMESLVFAVGDNACASENGTADKTAEGTLANIANYAIPVYFCPQEGKSYNATVTITDGTSTAEVTLSGTGKKLTQFISWEPETPIYTNATIAPAIASSGLPVGYIFSPEGIVTLSDDALTILGPGEVEITAFQHGNSFFKAAEPVTRTIVIYPAETHYEYSATICDGESYSDDNFSSLTQQALYFDTIPNQYGSDSVICLTLTVLPRYDYEESLSMYVGAQTTWQGFDLSAMPVGDTTLVAKYSTVHSCDSVYTLHLTVAVPPTTYGTDAVDMCEGDTAYYAGKAYTASATDSILLTVKNQFGGDSIVALTVTAHPLYAFSETKMMKQGTHETWQGIDLSTMPIGDTTLVAEYSSSYGCDSVYTLQLEVIVLPTTFGTDSFTICSGEKITYEGKTYKRTTVDSVLLARPNQYGGDSIVIIVVTVKPSMHMTTSKTITEGDEAEWQSYDLSIMPVGDTTLVAEYTSVYGCDSTYTLHLTVVEKQTTGIDETSVTPSARKQLRDGQIFIRKGEEYYDIFGRKRKL
jgi:hypothetical protein